MKYGVRSFSLYPHTKPLKTKRTICIVTLTVKNCEFLCCIANRVIVQRLFTKLPQHFTLCNHKKTTKNYTDFLSQ
jgi:hypothetical protein